MHLWFFLHGIVTFKPTHTQFDRLKNIIYLLVLHIKVNLKVNLKMLPQVAFVGMQYLTILELQVNDIVYMNLYT